MLKIKDQANTQLCDPEIVQHQPPFMVSDFVDHFCVYDDRIKGDQVGNKQPDVLTFVEDIKGRLLSKRNFSQAKFHDQSVLIWLLDDSMAERV